MFLDERATCFLPLPMSVLVVWRWEAGEPGGLREWNEICGGSHAGDEDIRWTPAEFFNGDLSCLRVSIDEDSSSDYLVAVVEQLEYARILHLHMGGMFECKHQGILGANGETEVADKCLGVICSLCRGRISQSVSPGFWLWASSRDKSHDLRRSQILRQRQIATRRTHRPISEKVLVFSEDLVTQKLRGKRLTDDYA